MRAALMMTTLVLALAACSSHVERTVVEPERTVVQPAPQPPATVVVPPPATVICPAGASC